jgi:hypothetical protein
LSSTLTNLSAEKPQCNWAFWTSKNHPPIKFLLSIDGR